MITGSMLRKYAVAGLVALVLSSASCTRQAKNAQANNPQAKNSPAKNPYQRFSFAGKRPTFQEGSIDKIEVVTSAADSEGRISVIESDWLPDFKVEPHYHKRHAETFYIVSGNVEWTIGGETHVMGSGDAVHIPPNTVHSVKVVGGKKMHSLMITEPGGYEENAWNAATYTPEQRKDPQGHRPAWPAR